MRVRRGSGEESLTERLGSTGADRSAARSARLLFGSLNVPIMSVAVGHRETNLWQSSPPRARPKAASDPKQRRMRYPRFQDSGCQQEHSTPSFRWAWGASLDFAARGRAAIALRRAPVLSISAGHGVHPTNFRTSVGINSVCLPERRTGPRPKKMARWKRYQTVIGPGRAKAYRCPCCNAKTLRGRGQFELCPVCYWEDDGMDTGNPRLEWARVNYRQFGACEDRWIHDVRPPRTGDR